MTPKLDPDQVVQLLAQHSRPVDENTIAELALTREFAVRNKHGNSSHWSFVGHVFTLPHIQYQWLIAGMLAAAIFVGVDAWQDDQDQQICDIDIAILTDELPLEVFVD